jgi:hypothetical protein
LGLYAIAALILRYDIWEVTRGGMVAGAVLIIGNLIIFGRIDITNTTCIIGGFCHN